MIENHKDAWETAHLLYHLHRIPLKSTNMFKNIKIMKLNLNERAFSLL